MLAAVCAVYIMYTVNISLEEMTHSETNLSVGWTPPPPTPDPPNFDS